MPRILLILLLAAGLSVGLIGQSEEALLWTKPSTVLPDWMRNQTIYEINVRQYSDEGTFAAVEADLDRIEDLGIGTLWFMPIHPIGMENRKGPLGSYYAVSDFFAVNPEFGTKADFRSLVQAAHQRGMRVILDWVGNHTAWDNPLATEHPESYKLDAEGHFQPPTGTDWTDVIQLDFDQETTFDYQRDALIYWVKEFDIDGYRCDAAWALPTRYWERLINEVNRVKKDLFWLAEAEQADQQLETFQASYGWSVMHAFNAIAQGQESASHIDDVLAQTGLQFPSGSDFLYLTSNHDENSWLGTAFERLGGGVEAFAVISFALDGIPLLYNGQEVGLNKRLEFFTRDPIEWRPHPLTDFYRTLITLKKEHPALATGARLSRVATTENDSIYALLRGDSGGPQILVVANLTAGNHAFGLGQEGLSGTWKDAFSGEVLELGESWQLELQSWKYRVLVRQP